MKELPGTITGIEKKLYYFHGDNTTSPQHQCGAVLTFRGASKTYNLMGKQDHKFDRASHYYFASYF